MTAFLSAVDIANRALQHCGATRIASMTEDSKNAAAVNFVYDKVRKAELRRNVWRFATRRAVLYPVTTGNGQNLANGPANPQNGQSSSAPISPPGPTMILNPSLWNSAFTYTTGSIVADVNGTLWTSKLSQNTNTPPGIGWSRYFGSLVANQFDPTQTYYPGDIVYETEADGKFKTFISLIGSNADDPSTPDQWSSTFVYFGGQVIQYNDVFYVSQINGNLGNEPDLSPAGWSGFTTYTADALVAGTDGYIYSSVSGGNTNNNPVTDLGVNWTNTGNLSLWSTTINPSTWGLSGSRLGSSQWSQLPVDLQSFSILYPVGTGPTWQSETRNVFLLPCGFLREAPQDPKAGASSYLGAPSGNLINDWTYEAGFLTSRTSYPIPYRFVADIEEVPTMDEMFCEGLAARIGLEICEELTQSTAKISTIAGAYARFMTEARTVNGIETGIVEPPVDDYIACRI